ncbi:MAG TPA: protein kinase, partial [Gemmatimonadales bacterium]|nr:protein kinase [Gemmatimonadales bacterium]
MSEFLARLRAVLHDRYRVERELGRGGMATVWLAEDLKNHRSVALKVLRPEIACALTAERFVRETRVTARLTHPNILPLFDSGEQGGFLYYVMPYVAGETLRQRLDREHQLPLDVAIRITCEVADALDYAHRHGVVHRDIKPENILLEEGHAIVADFGVARAITAATTHGDRLTDAGLAVGTLQYMSPEQASGGRDIDERADIYGLGCVLYEMLAGVPPFQGSVESVLRQHITASPPPLSTYRAGINPRIERAIAKALAKSPAERWRSGAALSAAVSGGGAAAYRVLVRRKVAAAVAITLAVIGTGAVVGRLLRPHPPNSVAVLYFANLSDDSADAYLANGLTEEIIARLGEMGRFAVKSRTALAALPGKSRSDPASIGRTLGVTHIVNGSVRRARSRFRVTVELVHARSGSHVWGAQFDRPDSDFLDVEESIAAAVAEQVEGQLAPARYQTRETRVSRDPVAYDHYLRGNHYLAQRTAHGVELAIDEYDIAARRDPHFIEALARQAYGYALFLYYGWPYEGISPESLLALGRRRADQALRADSTVAEAWLARGRMLEVANPVTYEGAIAAYRRASALDPQDPEIFNMLGASLRELGDDSGATRAFYQALRLDPDRATTLTLLGIQDA